MNRNLLYLIDTRTRFCEVGAWSISQTVTGDLVLRRVLSLGSLWDLKERRAIKFNGLVAVTDDCYQALSSEGFTSGGGRSWRMKNVAAIIESGGKTRIKAFRVHIFPEGTELSFPAKQPVQLNQAVRQAADAALLLRQHIAVGEWFISEGQSNTFRYAQLNWRMPEDTLLEFPTEHKESLAALWVGKNQDVVLRSFRPEASERKRRNEEMIMRNIDTCIECEKDVYEDEMNFDCEGNCYCPECYQAILGSPHKEEEEV